MKKKGLIPAGGLLIVLCFFLPWIRACNVDISGVQLATDRDIGDGILWLVPLAGLAILISYLVAKERARIFAVVSSLAGMMLLFVKILGPISRGQAREIGMSLQIGGYGTIIGLLLALIGGISAEYDQTASDDGPVAIENEPRAEPEGPPPSSEGPQAPVDIVKKAQAQGLMAQAEALGNRNDGQAKDQARVLWEAALQTGALDRRELLLCHYSLGSLYLSTKDPTAAAPHQEFVLRHDPDLGFLADVDAGTRRILKAELSMTSSAAFQMVASRMGGNGGADGKALSYLREKAGLFPGQAPPSILLEIGRLYSRQDDGPNAREWFQRAVQAPTFGSASEEESKHIARDLLRQVPPVEGPGAPAQGPVGDDRLPAVEFGQIAARKPSKWIKKAVFVVPAIAIVGAGLFFALPSPYKKHYRQAQGFYDQGLYTEAMAQVGLAKAHKSTLQLTDLEASIQAKIAELKERERRQRLKAEYDEWYGRAKKAYDSGDFLLARDCAVEAQKKVPTDEIRLLMAQIRDGFRRQRAEEMEAARAARQEEQAVPVDDTAFRAAELAGTVSGYYDYLRAHPDGPNASLARERIERLRQSAVQGLASSVSPQAAVGPANTIEMKNSLRQALRRLAERQTESTPQRPGAATIEISGERNREKQQWMDQTLNAIDAGLGHLGEARRVSVQVADRYATTLIDNWIALTQKAREQLVSKKLLSNKHSFENQRQVVQEIRNYLR